MTIEVDSDSCTRCGICSNVCPMGIITQAEENIPPFIPEEKSPMCVSCGQCEAFCSAGALIQDLSPGREVQKAWNGKDITPELLGLYLKSRRSIRRFKSESVPRESIRSILDIARYAASGSNGQPVQWLVIHDPKEVQRIAGLTINWMRTLAGSDHPMSAYVPFLIAAWEAGTDIICRGAPHLIIPHIPELNPIAPVDGIIALTHVDLTAPAFGIGACWGGFVAAASRSYAPLIDLLALPDGRIPVYALMLGYPQYKPSYIPSRKPLEITWK